jgi:hypothetical protein
MIPARHGSLFIQATLAHTRLKSTYTDTCHADLSGDSKDVINSG